MMIVTFDIRRKIAAFLFSLLLTIAAAACGSGSIHSPNGSTSSPPEVSTPSKTGTAAAVPESNTPAPFPTNTLTPTFTALPADEWISIGPEAEPNRICSLAVDPSTPATVYAGMSGYQGLFKSGNGGLTWRKLPAPVEFAYQAIAIDPVDGGTLYAGAFKDNHVYKSTDGGDTWDAADSGLPECGFFCYGIFSLAVHPKVPGTVYAGIFGAGIYKSMDGGAHWVAINNGLPKGAWVGDLAIDPIYSDILYAGTWGGAVFKSVAGGRYWYQIRYGMVYAVDKYVYSLAIDPVTTTTLYAGTEKNGVFKSVDGGKTWIAKSKGLPEGLRIIDIVIDLTVAETVYAAAMDYDVHPGSSGVYKSVNGGEDWNYLGMDESSISTLAIGTTAPVILYAGTDDGVYFFRQGAES